MTTIDNITDEQIEALRDEAAAAGDSQQVRLCNIALSEPGMYVLDRRIARKACVDAIRNAEEGDWQRHENRDGPAYDRDAGCDRY